MEVLLTVDLLLRLVQKLQHLPDDSLQRSAQVFTAVRLSQGGHMDECRAAVAKVQRCVVGEVTQIPATDDNTAYSDLARHSKNSNLATANLQSHMKFLS